jgi:hypothetical protein
MVAFLAVAGLLPEANGSTVGEPTLALDPASGMKAPRSAAAFATTPWAGGCFKHD